MPPSPIAPFKMQRRLRQGDILSSFLFVIATEGFNQLMIKVVEKNMFQDVKVGHEVVNVAYLQFVDDTFIFCPVKRLFLTNQRRILDCS